jgi:hypothetical protein
LNKKSFLAGQWLSEFSVKQQQNAQVSINEASFSNSNSFEDNPNEMLREEIEKNRNQALRGYLPSFSPLKINSTVTESQVESESTMFQPGKHLLSGWDGAALCSKASVKFKKSIEMIFTDAKSKFLNNANFNRSIKNNIYNEFLLYAQALALNLSELDQCSAFFAHLNNEDSPYKNELEEFTNLYCHRIAVIYFLKLRLINSLAQNTGKTLTQNNVSNPISFINSIFKKSGLYELHARSFAPNIFSWYRPSNELAQKLFEDIQNTTQLTISEIIKNTSANTQIKADDSQVYSHAISHRNFGLFLNSLLLNFPLWLAATNQNVKDLPAYGSQKKMEVISCKYNGDFLESLSVSHWLAQDNNKELEWDHVLCPDFKGNEFETGQFLELFNELQFMTFIIQFAKIHNKDTVKFLSEVVKKNTDSRHDTGAHVGQQHSLWSKAPIVVESSYDRVILNLHNFPKSNPNHHLYQQIQNQKSKVKEGGFLFVLSSKKLFVPSLKEKVESLLETFTLECCLCLDKVKGKGEVPSFIYILRKKYQSEIFTQTKKQYCLNFRLQADLDCFQEFSHIIDEVQNFFTNNLTQRPVMYGRQFHQNFTLECYQDAIVDGRLVRSSKKDSASITHPSFFKNLLSSCVPFDSFFEVGQISEDKPKRDNFGLPGLDFASPDSYPFVCIIDKRVKSQVNIEIINFNSYQAKIQQYGVTQCHYFGLRAKNHELNLNLFREFFNSRLGRQIINITFEGNSKKIKAKLNTLLIPAFFLKNKEIPDHIVRGFTLLNLDCSEILAIHPDELKQQYSYMESFIPSIILSYPAQTFAMLSFFKNSLTNVLDNNIANIDQISFKNPVICQELTKVPANNIYPENDEIFVEFKVSDMQSVYKIMTNFNVQKSKDVYQVELQSQDEIIAVLNCPEHIAMLLDVILSNLKGQPIAQLLTGIKVPTNEALRSVLDAQEDLTSTFRQIYNNVQNSLDKILTDLINQR